MIVDTSALVAITYRESGYERLREAILSEGGYMPAPALVEFKRVVTGRGRSAHPAADELIDAFVESSLDVEAFTYGDAEIATAANAEYGEGNGRGGRLNLLDLMVYAVAKRMDLPILCTGGDFASTDADIHPASRTQ
jgi:ribonuclease VapC